jgi:dipeptidyl aminopeptidase/acylaminoacyl peptidase
MGQDREQIGMYSVSESGGEPKRLTSLTERVSECDAIITLRVACVLQSPSLSPRPALIAVSDGSASRLADVNPELAAVELGPVTELHWTNEFGDATNGFLVLPRHRVQGARIPLVVVGYNFDGQFVTQASEEALTTYPVQALARDGIAVLLFNWPRYREWHEPDFQRGSRALGYSPLSSIQSILKKLDSDGLIDTSRLGMMGHSLAGFWVQLAITHTDLFKVVEMHNGGTASEPGTYWEPGKRQWRELQEQYMGGPPYGSTLKNYQEFSFSLNADKVRAPVLMEYDAASAASAMEYHQALRYYHLPVDFYVYPNDGHVTQRPEHRFMSLQRNLDWFEFWLLDKENDPGSKADQYVYWRTLREQAQMDVRKN